MELPLPEAVRRACALLAADSKQAYVVGGGIRDLILGITPSDWDLATDASPREAAAIFARAGCKVLPTGVKYGTITVYIGDFPIEVTTFRIEGGYRDRRRPDGVHFVGEIEQDLARRDFTINAIAYDPLRSLITDPCSGMRDMADLQLRAVGDPEARIGEDALRIMRAIRIAADYGLRIESGTWHAIVRNADLINKISAERTRDELNRTLMAANYMDGLQHLLQAGLLFLIIPELSESWLFPQFHPSHQHDVLNHTLEAMRYVPADLELRLAVLLHDVAKPRCFSRGADGRGHFYGHNLMSVQMAEDILQRLHYSIRTVRQVSLLVREHMLSLQMRHPAIRRLISRVGRAAIPGLLAVKEADLLAHSTDLIVHTLPEWEAFQARLHEVLAEEAAFNLSDLAINGTDLLEALDCQPGPLIGAVLKALWDEVLAQPQKNKRSYLLTRAGEIKKVMSKKVMSNESKKNQKK
ncbi:MAG: CCA tRNA nucleotidyltransferase [Thermacetogeniaceae bacterium]|jgi:tRNA nucleotidyltransferase/poly(A) polymerase